MKLDSEETQSNGSGHRDISQSGIPIEKALELIGGREDDQVLFSRARAAREAFMPDGKIAFCAIINAKSGRCPENCAFCSQSVHFKTGCDVYPLVAVEPILERARKVKEMGARAFSVVTSGSRLEKATEIDAICEAISRIREELGLECCASLGRTSYPVLQRLKEAGLLRYHHNLETAHSHFEKICTTYTYDESLDTIRAAASSGLKVCSGGIFGMGESLEQRVELGQTLRQLEIGSVPINFLNPRPGTPLADLPLLSAEEALRAVAVFRLMMPARDILVAGGRELVLGEKQDLLFQAGANALMVGNYLTTGNRNAERDRRMVSEQGYSLREPTLS